MLGRLLGLVICYSFVVGVAAGMPLHVREMDDDCCPKRSFGSPESLGSLGSLGSHGNRKDSLKVKKGERPFGEQSMARVCCALNCSSPAPVSVVSFVNMAPASVVVTDSVARQIAKLFDSRGRVHPLPAKALDTPRVEARKFPPKYLLFGSILI